MSCLSPKPFGVVHHPFVILVEVGRLPDVPCAHPRNTLTRPDNDPMLFPVDPIVRCGQLMAIPVSARTGQVVHVVSAAVEVQPRVPHQSLANRRIESGLNRGDRRFHPARRFSGAKQCCYADNNQTCHHSYRHRDSPS